MNTPGKYSYKKYSCTHCGNVSSEGTNHWGDIYSRCIACSWKRPAASSIKSCMEPMPQGAAASEPWKINELGEIYTYWLKLLTNNPNICIILVLNQEQGVLRWPELFRTWKITITLKTLLFQWLCAIFLVHIVRITIDYKSLNLYNTCIESEMWRLWKT